MQRTTRKVACISSIVGIASLFILLAVTLLSPHPMTPTTIDSDFQESVDASIARYTAYLTNARLDDNGKPPTSTLTITEGQLATVVGEWTLGSKEFWTADPDANVLEGGSWDVNKRCYTHDVWTGDYSPGTPLTQKTSRDFCF